MPPRSLSPLRNNSFDFGFRVEVAIGIGIGIGSATDGARDGTTDGTTDGVTTGTSCFAPSFTIVVTKSLQPSFPHFCVIISSLIGILRISRIILIIADLLTAATNCLPSHEQIYALSDKTA